MSRAIRAPVAEGYPRLLLGLRLAAACALVYFAYLLFEEPPGIILGALLIFAAALLPMYLWASGRAPGLPVFPLHALALSWTYAVPLAAGHPEIAAYGTDEILFAAVLVALYALVGSACWYLVGRSGRPRPARAFYVLPEDRGFALFTGALVFGAVFILLVVSQTLSMDAGLFGIVRSSVLAFASIALFVLACRMGRGELVRLQRWVFIAAAAFYVLAQLSTVFLVGAIISMASGVIGYTVGARRLPWALIAAAILGFSVLHAGKSEMRERYWDAEAAPIGILATPGFLAEWSAAGLAHLLGADPGVRHQPLYERLSLMHLLLLVQRVSPEQVPYLAGATYAPVPALLVPRIFDPDKPVSHAGTTMLNVEYGLQTDEDTQFTTIGWGLLNEAYANFGAAGVLGLALLLGLLFGSVGRLTAEVPLMSLRTIAGVVFAAIALQSEFTMGVFATALFQSLAALLLLSPFLARQPSAPGGAA